VILLFDSLVFKDFPMKYGILFGSFLLGCAAAGAVEAGSGSHGGAPKPKVVVEQDVVVSPGVEVRETVEVDGPGDVTVIEKVEVGGPGAGGAPIGVHAARKDARKAYRATVAEAKAERRAGRFSKKAANAEHEAEAEAIVKQVYSN
jgi:hypothetical protein